MRIDDELAAFMEQGVSVILATCNAALVPSLVRATGSRVDRATGTVSVFVSMSHAGGVLADLREHGRIAVVYSKPSTHRSIQVKGADARIVPLREGDWASICLYREALVQDITGLGYPAAVIRSMLSVEREDMVAVTFTPDAVFQQTPGPDAGKPLGAAG